MTDLKHNKQTVIEFYTRALNDHEPADAVASMSGRNTFNTIRIHPMAPTHSSKLQRVSLAKFPRISVEIKRVIAEGDLVVTHNLVKMSAEDRGMAGVDIFRLRDGKIVHHDRLLVGNDRKLAAEPGSPESGLKWVYRLRCVRC